jgi:hypothetical protein
LAELLVLSPHFLDVELLVVSTSKPLDQEYLLWAQQTGYGLVLAAQIEQFLPSFQRLFRLSIPYNPLSIF